VGVSAHRRFPYPPISYPLPFQVQNFPQSPC
jgi:hypothetical protein